jgi:fluoride exporter
MTEIFYVGVAGFFGAISRFFFYKLEAKIPLNTFPYATLAVNLLGCLLLGICLGLGVKALPQQKHLLTLFSMGFIGSFTTFSAFSNETLNLIQGQLWPQAFLNISLNVVLGIVMVFAGKSILQFF